MLVVVVLVIEYFSQVLNISPLNLMEMKTSHKQIWNALYKQKANVTSRQQVE